MANVARTSEEQTAIKQITPDELIGYISSMNTGTKKGTYYNESNEQVSAMAENVNKMIDVFRPFAVRYGRRENHHGHPSALHQTGR